MALPPDDPLTGRRFFGFGRSRTSSLLTLLVLLLVIVIVVRWFEASTIVDTPATTVTTPP
jgi:hypothetical protein